MRNNLCSACGAALMWIRLPSGKSMPCDPAPVYYIATGSYKKGAKRIVTPNGQVLPCEYTEDPNKATGVGYIPHWATCPRADSFRRPAKRSTKNKE